MEQSLINDGYIDPDLGLGEIFKTSLEWMRLREVNPFSGNLLENPNFAGDNKHPWKSRGFYELESSDTGHNDPFPEEAGCNEDTKCIATNNRRFTREQTVNLLKVPKMKQMFALYDVYACRSVWIAPRFTNQSEYKSWINSEVMGYVKLPAGIAWAHHEGSVKVDSLKKGVVYKEQTKDKKYLLNLYGAKVLNPTVRLRLQEKEKRENCILK